MVFCGGVGWAEGINDPRATAAEGLRRATTAYHQNMQKKKKKMGAGGGGSPEVILSPGGAGQTAVNTGSILPRKQQGCCQHSAASAQRTKAQ